MNSKSRKWIAEIRSWVGQRTHGIAVASVQRRYSRKGPMSLDAAPKSVIEFLWATKLKTRWTMPDYKTVQELVDVQPGGNFEILKRKGGSLRIAFDVDETRDEVRRLRPITRLVAELADELGCDSLHSLYRSIYRGTDCGPSIGFLIGETPELAVWHYCDSLGTFDGRFEPTPNFKSMRKAKQKVYGVSVSSIVEGSDVDIPGDVLLWEKGKPRPTKDEFWNLVEHVNDEACFYWERDNSRYFSIKDPNGMLHYLRECWGDFEWGSDDIDTEHKQTIVTWLAETDLTFEYDVPVPIEPLYGWWIIQWVNDMTY